MKDSCLAQHHISISQLFFVTLFCVALLGNPYFAHESGIRYLSWTIACIFVVVAALGRLWCSLYLGGYKTSTLIEVGPYSMVRNPLYIFSFIGSVGIGIATTSIVITSLFIIFFAAVYPIVIADEERRMDFVFGSEYREYVARTPRLIPNHRLYKGVSEYTINIRQVHSAFFDVIWFFIALGLMQLVVHLHNSQQLPRLFDIY